MAICIECKKEIITHDITEWILSNMKNPLCFNCFENERNKIKEKKEDEKLKHIIKEVITEINIENLNKSSVYAKLKNKFSLAEHKKFNDYFNTVYDKLREVLEVINKIKIPENSNYEIEKLNKTLNKADKELINTIKALNNWTHKTVIPYICGEENEE